MESLRAGPAPVALPRPSHASLSVALASVKDVEAEEVLEISPELDVLILSRGDTHYRKARRIGETIVAYAPAEGQYLGRFRLEPGGSASVEWLSLYSAGLIDREVADRIDALNRELREIRKAEARRRAPSPRDKRWAGTQACAPCHAGEVEKWERSGHARAMATLVKVGRDFDPDCIRCHVTAWDDGYIDPLSTPQFADVQCEACHGPGSAHVQDPSRVLGATGRELCLSCHTEENSPEFNAEEYRERIRHW